MTFIDFFVKRPKPQPLVRTTVIFSVVPTKNFMTRPYLSQVTSGIPYKSQTVQQQNVPLLGLSIPAEMSFQSLQYELQASIEKLQAKTQQQANEMQNNHGLLGGLLSDLGSLGSSLGSSSNVGWVK